MAGLTAIQPTETQAQMPAPIAPGGEMGMVAAPEPPAPTGVATVALGQLRNLGRRTIPSEGAVFQGLKRIY